MICNWKTSHWLSAGLLLWVFVFSAVAAPKKKLKVLTTFLPVYCFTANVAGDLAEVENLLPDGVGPHDYSFSPKDLRRLANADLVVMNGLGVDDWLEKSIRAAGAGRIAVVRMNEGAGKRAIRDHGAVNPHVWLDPTLSAHAVTNILLALQRADAENAGQYAANASRYVAKLQDLDNELAEGLQPFSRSAFLTFHEAFPYFVRRYGLNLAGVIEEVPDVEPSARRLASLIRDARKKNVKVIFLEPQFSSRMARMIADDLGIPVAELDPLETGPMKPEAYEEGMRRNLQTLQRYLK